MNRFIEQEKTMLGNSLYVPSTAAFLGFIFLVVPKLIEQLIPVMP